MAKKDPLFLVVVDDSEEMHHALRFACGRAKAVGGKVALMYCIAPTDFEYWAGVGELMRAEARDELLALIDEEEQISLLVLGADTNSETADPLISFLMSKGAARCRVPITVVPGNLTDDQIDALF